MKNPFISFLHLLWRALAQFNADHGPNHAAAVAYFSLLSLPPFLLLAGRLVGTNEAVVAVASFLPSEIATSIGAFGETLTHGNALVAIAVPVLIWVASHAFSSLEVAVNVAFGTTPLRRFWLSRLKAFAGLSLCVVVLGTTIVGGHLAAWLDRYYTRAGAPRIFSPSERMVSLAGIIAVTFVVFTLFYKALPRGKVRWSAAAQAAAIAVVLWEAARQIFGRLLAKSPAFGWFSGTLAGGVTFLGWIYVAVVVVIFGAEVASLLNGNRPPARDDRRI
jgi:membrane protein